MSKTIRMAFDHAVQRVYNVYGKLVSENTITSGTAYIGYQKGISYNEAFNGNRYFLDIYYRIPAKAYQYAYNKVAKTYEESSTVTTIYYEGSGLISDIKGSALASNTYKGRTEPGTFTSSSIRLNEYDVNIMQKMGSTYFVTNAIPATKGPEKVVSGTYETNAKYTVFTTITNIQNSYIDFEVDEISLSVEPTYPVDVYVRNDRDFVFTWNIYNSINRSNEFLYQTGFDLDIYKLDGTMLYHRTVTGAQQQITVPANSINVAEQVKYSLTVRTNYDNVVGSVNNVLFTLTGVTDAPSITAISQNSFPIIFWSCPNQISWQMIIKNDKSVVFDSGMMSGSAQSYQVPKFLEDGIYSLEMRALNSYGLYTAWASTAFGLNPPKPEAPNNIMVSVNNDFGVSIFCNKPSVYTKLYVVRRKNADSIPEIIGEYFDGFVDYKIPLNVNYEYAVRNYVQGYTDTEWKDATVISKGVIIRNAENLADYAYVWKTDNDEFDVLTNTTRSDTLLQCVGRTYPVAEVGEWITSTRNFRGYTETDEYIKLRKMKANVKNIIFQNTEEVIPCYMEIKDSGKYIDGRLIEFSLTRIDGD